MLSRHQLYQRAVLRNRPSRNVVAESTAFLISHGFVCCSGDSSHLGLFSGSLQGWHASWSASELAGAGSLSGIWYPGQWGMEGFPQHHAIVGHQLGVLLLVGLVVCAGSHVCVALVRKELIGKRIMYFRGLDGNLTSVTGPAVFDSGSRGALALSSDSRRKEMVWPPRLLNQALVGFLRCSLRD